MAESVRITSKPIRRQYPDSAIILNAVTIGRKSGNTISPPEGKNNFSIQLESAITEEEYNRLEASGVTSIGRGETNGKEIFYSVVGIIEDNQISTTDATPENVERDLPNLKTEAIDAINEQITNEGSKVSPTVPSNVAPTNTQTSSTPVATGLGQGVSFKSDSSILVYPANMSDSQDRIQFSIWEYKNRNAIKNENEDSDAVGRRAFALTESLVPSTPGTEMNNYQLAKNKENVSFPFVYLPITKISDTNAVDWNEDRMNSLQLQLASISMNLMRGGEDSNSAASKQTDQLIEYATSRGFGSMVLAYLAGQAVGVGGLLTRTTGSVLNPNLELLFQSPQLRQFAFSFSMFAKNKDEATKIKSIIKFFKQNMATRKSDDSNIFLNSPYVFRIKYLSGNPKGGSVENTPDHPSIGKIKMCALQSCTTDYTPLGSYMTFNDTDKEGTPISTMVMYNMTLNFKELHPIYDVDYNDSHPIGF
jgi:hypothetical protein